ncbi:MAG: glycosyltransferase family 9 protein [candidate division Zixibacteria bacterium]
MYKKIAFLKLCCPGDLLFTTPAVRAVRAAYPDAELYYLTGKYSSFIPDHNPHIIKTIIVEPPYEKAGVFSAINAYYRGINKIAKEEFDLLICFHRSMFAASLGYFGRGATVIGFQTALPMVDKHIPFDPAAHEVQRYLDLTSIFGCEPEGTELEYRVDPEDEEKAETLLKKSGISGDFAVIAPGGGENPGTTMHIKRWPTSGYKAIVSYIKDKFKLPVIAVGSGSECELAERIEPDLNLAGKTTFPILAAVLRKSSITLANDSGPLYLASAVGTKTVGIYGPSSDDLVAPLAENHRSVKKPVWCQPCYHPENVKRGTVGCSSGTWACMLALDREKVIEAVESLLG